MRRWALVALLAGLPAVAGARPLIVLRPVSVEGCPGVPVSPGSRELAVAGSRVVDARARFWNLDRPADFHDGRATRTYRVGNGSLRVDAVLSPDFTEERVTLAIEDPVGPLYLNAYLDGFELPCERVTRYRIEVGREADADPGSLADLDAHLHRSAELIYDARFDAAREELRAAIAVRRSDPAPYWMMARLIVLELEQSHDVDRSVRIEAYEEAERWADQAVDRAPELAEGYLWQGIARGRIATSLGSIRLALTGAIGGRGPAWLEATLRKAAALPDTYDLFGFRTRGDALYALAQFYRLAPDGWYMSLVGTRGDRDRAVAVARRAVEIQPLRLEYRKELAVALLCRGLPGDTEDAARELRELLELPSVTAIDRVDRAHARALLAAPPDNVCWYSRDGFLESVS